MSERLRAYYNKNGGLAWNNPTSGNSGVLNKRRLGKYMNINIHGNPVIAGYYYRLASGRTLPINMWRIFEAPRRKKKPVPTSSPITFAKSAIATRNARMNGGLARALRNPNSINAVAATLKVLESPSLMKNLTINNIIKILSSPNATYPANKLSNLRNILVNKLIQNGTSNNIYNASMEVNFTNSQNAKLTRALHARGFT